MRAMRSRTGVLLTFLVLLLPLCGCATVGTEDGELKMLSGADPASATMFHTGHESYSVNLLVRVDWKTAGTRQHEIVAPTRGKYLLFAYEEGRGLVPLQEIRKKSENAPKNPLDPTARALLEGLAQGAFPLIASLAILSAPIWGPIYLSSRSEALPSAGYLWMEDAETGEQLAGRTPWE